MSWRASSACQASLHLEFFSMCWRSFTDWGFYVPKSWDLKFSHFQKTFVNKVSLAFKSNSQFMAIVLCRACFRPKAWDSEEIFAGQKRHLVLTSLAMDLGARSQGCMRPISFSKASWFEICQIIQHKCRRHSSSDEGIAVVCRRVSASAVVRRFLEFK